MTLKSFFIECRRRSVQRRRGVGFGTKIRDKSRKGIAAVEMALLLPVFFFMLIGVIEMSLMFTAQQLLENASFNASRLAKTGYVSSGSTQMQTIMQVLTQELQSYGTFINTGNITLSGTAYNSFSSIGTGGTTGLGAAQQIVVYTVSYPWKLMTPMMGAVVGTGGIVTLTSTIVVRNEPYS